MVNDMDFQQAFKENLKYISSTFINPEVIERQFVKSDSRYYITVGTIDVCSGNIVVCDPLAYLAANRFCPVLEKKIPKGKYPVVVAICRNEEIGIRMSTIKLKIKDEKVVKYQCAKPTKESAFLKDKDGNVYSGFPVDAGMITICDMQVGLEYYQYLDKWYQNHPDGNHYDDYFAAYFKASARKLPQYQCDDGDFIEWCNPDTNNRLVMIASGLGDGFYQCFWGYDNNDEICELIVPMINPDLFEIE